MEKLKQSQAILSLGKKLVEEFSEDGQCKMTLRWMSHYLAECIIRAEAEKAPSKKSRLEKECCNIIVELWKNRKDFPGRSKPLSNLNDAMAVLSALIEKQRDMESWNHFLNEQHLDGWGSFTKALVNHFNDLVAISLCATVTKNALKTEKKWLDHRELLSEEEREIIERLDTLLNKGQTFHQILVALETPVRKEQNEVPQSRLEKVFETMQEHINDLQKKLDLLRTNMQKEVVKKSRK